MNLFLVAWRTSGRLPVSVVRAAAGAIAWYAWVTRAKPVRTLEGNLGRVTGAEGRQLRRLSRRGMSSVARYYSEVLELGRMTGASIDARVRMHNYEDVRAHFEGDRGLVAVLSHCGNWDLVGAYAARNLIPITAVAEVLKPREVFDEFVALREQVGIHVLGHEGSSTFRELVRDTRSTRVLSCLLSDRDISGSGVLVSMWGQGVKVAPGPAALAVAAKTVVVPVMVHYERLSGARRRAARSRWGVVMTFGPVIDHADHDAEDRVSEMSQRWAGWFENQIAAHPEDWHMLQRFGWAA